MKTEKEENINQFRKENELKDSKNTALESKCCANCIII